MEQQQGGKWPVCNEECESKAIVSAHIMASF